MNGRKVNQALRPLIDEAALRAAHAGAVNSTQHQQTPNGWQTIASGFTPTEAGKVLVAVVITPRVSGNLRVSANFEMVPSTSDTPSIAGYFVQPVTGVSGGDTIVGTPLNGITVTPTSTTPLATSGTNIFEPELGAGTAFEVTVAAVPVQAVVGEPVLIAFVLGSGSNTTTYSVDGTIVVDEGAVAAP